MEWSLEALEFSDFLKKNVIVLRKNRSFSCNFNSEFKIAFFPCD